jgi:hypothetical protein
MAKRAKPKVVKKKADRASVLMKLKKYNDAVRAWNTSKHGDKMWCNPRRNHSTNNNIRRAIGLKATHKKGVGKSKKKAASSPSPSPSPSPRKKGKKKARGLQKPPQPLPLLIRPRTRSNSNRG